MVQTKSPCKVYILLWQPNFLKLNLHWFYLLEFKLFLENHKEYWALKQREADERYMELAQGQVPVNEPKQKKRKKSKKEMLPEHTRDDTFSTYAAELQIQFFVKVSYYYETNGIWSSDFKYSCTTLYVTGSFKIFDQWVPF